MSWFNRSLFSYIFRGTQLLFSVIVLGTAAGVVSNGITTGRAGFNLAVAIITILYVSPLLVTNVVSRVPALGAFIAEMVLFLFWIIAFALIADAGYAQISSCDFKDYGFYWKRDIDLSKWSTTCKTGKALFVFSLFLFLLELAALGLSIAFIIVPIAKTKVWNFASANNLVVGGLFHQPVTLTKPDEETRIESDEQKVESPVESPNLEEQAVASDPLPDSETGAAK